MELEQKMRLGQSQKVTRKLARLSVCLFLLFSLSFPNPGKESSFFCGVLDGIRRRGRARPLNAPEEGKKRSTTALVCGGNGGAAAIE